MTSTPHLVVVDVETSGLDPRTHCVLEVAAIDLTTGEELHFVPNPRRNTWRSELEPSAMRINRYYERGLYLEELDVDTTSDRWAALNTMLDGNLIAGANPWFDAAFLEREIEHRHLEPSWLYRHRDLATYAAGVLGHDTAEPTTAASVMDDLGVVNGAPHTAYGDACAEADAFLDLMKRAGARP